jgi:hypothetical protein
VDVVDPPLAAFAVDAAAAMLARVIDGVGRASKTICAA